MVIADFYVWDKEDDGPLSRSNRRARAACQDRGKLLIRDAAYTKPSQIVRQVKLQAPEIYDDIMACTSERELKICKDKWIDRALNL